MIVIKSLTTSEEIICSTMREAKRLLGILKIRDEYMHQELIIEEKKEMEIKVTRRELDIILACLSGTRFENHDVEVEKGVLHTALIEVKNEYERRGTN